MGVPRGVCVSYVATTTGTLCTKYTSALLFTWTFIVRLTNCRSIGVTIVLHDPYAHLQSMLLRMYSASPVGTCVIATMQDVRMTNICVWYRQLGWDSVYIVNARVFLRSAIERCTVGKEFVRRGGDGRWIPFWMQSVAIAKTVTTQNSRSPPSPRTFC